MAHTYYGNFMKYRKWKKKIQSLLSPPQWGSISSPVWQMVTLSSPLANSLQTNLTILKLLLESGSLTLTHGWRRSYIKSPWTGQLPTLILISLKWPLRSGSNVQFTWIFCLLPKSISHTRSCSWSETSG